jgi:TM2 domain-containing membrane protein YozV
LTKITVASTEEEIDLKDPIVAAALAWLVPGLGHLYQGRRAKGLLFMVCILGTFFYGLFLSDGRAVYASWSDWDRRLPYLCQVGVGLPALPALAQNYLVRNGKEPLFGGVMAPPATMQQLNESYRQLHRYLELGTVYTMIAGLLNILAIYDAFGGPVQLTGRAEMKREDEVPGEPARAAGEAR